MINKIKCSYITLIYRTFALDMKTRIHIFLLSLCVLALAVATFFSIYSTVRFDDERAQREQTVIARMVKIRAAEEMYRSQHGRYTDQLDSLVAEHLLADSLTTVPYSGGQRFALTVSTQLSHTGRPIPLIECSATYAAYLKGLDAEAVATLAAEANTRGQFLGLKFGSLDIPGYTSGNWE